jgi:hypothetical protein
MALSEAKVNLTAEGFPFCFDELSNTVFINAGLEQQRTLLGGFDGAESVQSFGVMQAFYLQNVLPHTRGYLSAHYSQLHEAAAVDVFTEPFTEVFTLKEAPGAVALFAPANGTNYIMDGDSGIWESYPFPGTVAVKPSVAYLKGVSYICYPGLGLYRYNFQSKRIEAQVMAGINPAAVRGVCAANGFLLIWDANTLYWSSFSNPLDFLPGLDTGAGSTSILATRGELTQVLAIADGFIVYTTFNAVAATYTGDAANPWIFREVPGSAGLSAAEQVSYEANLENHFAWTSRGMQLVAMREAVQAWDELSFGLSRRKYSRLLPGTVQPETVVSSQPLEVRLSTVGVYVAISVRDSDVHAAGEYGFAYLYDTGTRRWGRLDVLHADILEYFAPAFAPTTSYQDLLDAGTSYQDLLDAGTSYQDLGDTLTAATPAYGTTFAIVQPTGRILRVHTGDALADVTEVVDVAIPAPVLLHGRYRLVRTRGIELQEVQVTRGADFQVIGIVHDANGDYVREVPITATQYATVAGRFLCRVPGDAVSIAVMGSFNITDITLRMRASGNRNSPRRAGIVV